jgi:enoyl-CoA hydratase/carnithine racemase
VVLGGDLHSAEELASWGAVDRVVAADELHTAAEAFARQLAAGPTLAYAAAKDIMRAYADGVEGADALLLDAAVGLFDTEDAQTGIATVLESGPGKTTFAGR